MNRFTSYFTVTASACIFFLHFMNKLILLCDCRNGTSRKALTQHLLCKLELLGAVIYSICIFLYPKVWGGRGVITWHKEVPRVLMCLRGGLRKHKHGPAVLVYLLCRYEIHHLVIYGWSFEANILTFAVMQELATCEMELATPEPEMSVLCDSKCCEEVRRGMNWCYSATKSKRSFIFDIHGKRSHTRAAAAARPTPIFRICFWFVHSRSDVPNHAATQCDFIKGCRIQLATRQIQ